MTGVALEIPAVEASLFAAAATTVLADLPAIVVEDGKRSLLDLLASCAATDGRVWDTDVTDPAASVLRNAFRAHVVDFDPVHPRAHGHPAAMLFPALLPYYTSGKCSGADLIAAYAVGHEVMCVFGELAGRALRAAHRHPTCVLGAIAVSVATGRILGLDADRLCHAAFLCAATTTGQQASFGSEAKAYQLAVAARNGLTAALAIGSRMVRRCSTTPSVTQVLRESLNTELAFDGVAPFGEPWRVETTGTFHKPIPICGYLITTVLGFQHGLRRGSPASADVESLHVGVPWSVAAVCRHEIPRDVDEARFALGFLMAVCLTGPVEGWESRFARLIRDPDVTRLTASAVVLHDPDGDVDGLVRVTMRLRAGDAYHMEIPVNGDGLTLDGPSVVRAKWLRYMAPRFTGDDAQHFESATRALEHVSGPDWLGLLAKASPAPIPRGVKP